MQKADLSKSNETMVEKMFRAGAHYGYRRSRRHPSVSPYIYAVKNRTDIINLEKTEELLKKAAEFLKTLGSQNKTVLWVGTKPEAKETVKEAAESLGMPYVTERWIGGTLSNFGEIKKRINELENYQRDSLGGGLEKYTKKERLVLAKKMEKLARYYTGLLNLKKAPDALFVVDGREEHIAVKEAEKSNVPIVALANSDSNIKNINYPIVANDAGIPSIKFFASVLEAAYQEGKNSAPIEKTGVEKNHK